MILLPGVWFLLTDAVRSLMDHERLICFHGARYYTIKYFAVHCSKLCCSKPTVGINETWSISMTHQVPFSSTVGAWLFVCKIRMTSWGLHIIRTLNCQIGSINSQITNPVLAKRCLKCFAPFPSDVLRFCFSWGYAACLREYGNFQCWTALQTYLADHPFKLHISWHAGQGCGYKS